MERHNQKHHSKENDKRSVQEQCERSLWIVPPKIVSEPPEGITVSPSGENTAKRRESVLFQIRTDMPAAPNTAPMKGMREWWHGGEKGEGQRKNCYACDVKNTV